MSNKQNEFIEIPSNTFGYEVPVFEPSIFREFRGEIWTTFHSEEHPVMRHLNYDKNDISIHGRFSRSYKNVLRGLHYDTKTWKLVQCIVGEMYLVVADNRELSPTYGKWESFLLSERNRKQVLVPPGFGNGFYSITDNIFHYNLFYEGEYIDVSGQGVIKWNDPFFNI